MHGNVADLAQDAMVFRTYLRGIKARLEPESFWYPYDTLSNFQHFEQLLHGEHSGALNGIRGLTIADVGAGDGDLSFFFESLGNQVDIVDHAPTNFNGLRGAERLREYLGSAVTVNDVDLDSQFALPRPRYDVVFFLGILYHLKNPFFVMESLSRRAATCFLSTKVMKFAGTPPVRLAGMPLAYLLAADEANNDPTNFWVFTDDGLKRLLARSGWDVLAYTTVGNVLDSDPATSEGDERAFCYLRSRRVAADR